MAVLKRLIIVLGLVITPLLIGLLFAYDVIKVDWLSFMEVQPSFKAQRDPLPLPPDSVPVQGAAYIPAVGEPVNPNPGDAASIQRGKTQYETNCLICHGVKGDGNGPFSVFLQKKKPANLLQGNALTKSDGYIFVTITNGVQDAMPSLKENLPTAAMRWDVVNYVRSLQKNGK
jgi:mono/diheme cytochrome c family protein